MQSDAPLLIWGRLVRELRQLPTRFVPTSPAQIHSKLDDRPVYGNPTDFRGLRHELVNENGVIFLFSIVAR